MTKEQLEFQEAMAFEVWMRETIKSVHYADNLQMANAYDKFIDRE